MVAIRLERRRLVFWHISISFLILVVISQVAIVYLLAKVIGGLYERIGDQGALVTPTGPPVGYQVPATRVIDSRGQEETLVAPVGSTLRRPSRFC